MTAGEEIPPVGLTWELRTAPGFASVDEDARKNARLSEGWRFHKIDSIGNISGGEDVQFPHSFERNRDYKSGWYLSRYELDQDKKTKYVLMLSRVQMFSMVYVNGQFCGQHFGCYTPFEIDITSKLVQGKNTIALFVYDQSASVDGDKLYNQVAYARLRSIYNPNASASELPGGILDVPILEERAETHLTDIFIKTSTRKKEMEIEYELSSMNELKSNSTLSFELFKWPGGEKVDLDIPVVQLRNMSGTIESCKIKWADPELWSPDHPELYVLRSTLQNGKRKDLTDTRFGFREFWVEGKAFMLNGIPTRLRGESYYAPVLKGRDFHREVFLHQKEIFELNACRLHAFMPPAEVIIGADEAGILLIDQSAIWSENASYYRNGGEWFLKNTEKEFEEWARRDRNNPSVVIWDVENEMLRVSYELHLPWVKKLRPFIEKFDDTRPFNNSGQGWVSPDQDMVLLHMQEHYSKIISDWEDRGTKPLINGEFWVGGRAESRLPNSPELESANQRYVEEAEIYRQQMLEMRYHGVTGIMPFRISSLYIPGSRNPVNYDFTSPDQLVIKHRSDEVIQKIKHGIQAVSLFFWQQQDYVAAGESFQKQLVLCNDSERADEFKISWNWENQSGKTKTVFLEPTGQHRFLITEDAPARSRKLIATVSAGNKILSSDTLLIKPISTPEKDLSKLEIQVYKDEPLAEFLQNAGYYAISKETIPENRDRLLWIIPEHANNRELNLIRDEILGYLEQGGNILCLKQDQAPTWFPTKLHFWSAIQTSPHTYANMGWEGLNKHLFFSTEAPIYAGSHPVFSGINSRTLHVWNKDDGRVSDDVFVRPSNVNIYNQGNWRPLAGGTRREHVSLAEFFLGKGILLSCQLHVIENFDNIQAKTLFVNMLSYLTDETQASFDSRVSIKGNVEPGELAEQLGASEYNFQGARAENHDLMIAFDGTDISEVKEWTSKGGTAMIFSPQLTKDFEYIGISSNSEKEYYATKIAEHPLLCGVASANFLFNEVSVIRAYFSEVPSNAKILLQGFSNSQSRNQGNPTDLWSIEDAGPVMISLPFGNGEILLSTINFSEYNRPSVLEFLSLLLTNSGVEIPVAQSEPEEIAIKKTVPLIIDGRLNDWLEDMEDRLVTKYIHAQPIYLTSECIVEGPPEFDLNLSAIDYFMWNEEALCIAGVVFTEEKTFESGIQFGREKEYEMDIRYNDDVIIVSYKDGVGKVSINGMTEPGAKLETGQIESKNLTDATILQFSFIQKSGKIAVLENLTGATFELMIPWDSLTSKPSDESSRALITVSSKGSKLQVPLTAGEESRENWMRMRIE